MVQDLYPATRGHPSPLVNSEPVNFVRRDCHPLSMWLTFMEFTEPRNLLRASGYAAVAKQGERVDFVTVRNWPRSQLCGHFGDARGSQNVSMNCRRRERPVAAADRSSCSAW